MGRGSDLADANAHKDNPEVPMAERIVPRWRPNQLRHAAATKIRQQFGLEASQVLLGHARVNITETYADARQLGSWGCKWRNKSARKSWAIYRLTTMCQMVHLLR